jgi:WD40 repeat protein
LKSDFLSFHSEALRLNHFLGLSDEIIQKLDQKSQSLTQSRKSMLAERKKTLNGVEKLHNYSKTKSFPSLHGKNHIMDVDISAQNNSRFVTGGADNSVVVFDRDTEKVISKFTGHTGSINKVRTVFICFIDR